jgi:molybdate transport system substrate-binding protein
MKHIAVLALALALLPAWALPARAADITLLASNAINVILDELVPQFERANNHRVKMRLGIASTLRKNIEAGAVFDAAILVGGVEGLVARGTIARDSSRALGRSGYGVAVRAGAPKPDISTRAAFTETMLRAKSVGYTEGGGSGSYFLHLLERLGIAEAMKPKLHGGINMQAAVAKGEVEMTVNGIVPILRAPGIELAGPLPPELQSYSTFTIGVSPSSRQGEAALALVHFLTTPDAIRTFARHGVEPVQ